MLALHGTIVFAPQLPEEKSYFWKVNNNFLNLERKHNEYIEWNVECPKNEFSLVWFVISRIKNLYIEIDVSGTNTREKCSTIHSLN